MTEKVDNLEELAAQAGRDLEGDSATDVLRWADETFGSRFVIASSMADGVLAHLASKVASGIEVLFLDTGYHFAETLGTRDAVAQVYDVTVRTVLPVLTVGQQEAVYGGQLLQRDPDACCAIRKVEPLTRGRAPRQGQGQPARDLDAGAVRRLHRRQQHPGQPAAVRRLPLDRLRALHPAGSPRR